MVIRMDNLMKEIDASLEELNLLPISDVVNNRKKCLRYINGILQKNDNKVIIPFCHTSDKYDFRVKHVLFSFGLGLFLSQICGLRRRIEESYRENYEIDENFTYIWLTVCLYHDFGYFIGPEYIGSETLESLRVDYDIFKTDYCNSRYSEQLFSAYYNRRYREQKWGNNKYDMPDCEEVGDHGILGGYILFQRLCATEVRPIPPTNKNPLVQAIYEYDSKVPLNYHWERIPLYQDICFRIMEHNIWKQQTPEALDSPFLEIDVNHFRRISIEEPLLFLLCLVDTIEMTKRFCRYSDSGSEKSHYIYPRTIGSKVFIETSNDELFIDYRELVRTIHQNGYSCDIQKWVDGVAGLSDWVQVDVEHIEGEYILKIFPRSLASKESLYSTTALACAR